MEWLLSFAQGLIILTVGFICLLGWLAAIVLISVETYDFVVERKKKPEDEWEDY